MRRKQLLFSKREKNEKATGMSDENENQEGNLGLPNNNSQQSENTNNNNKNKNTESKNNENKTQIEKVSNEVFNKEKIKIKSIKDLNKELNQLEIKLKQERNESISKVNELNEEDAKKTAALKKLSNEFNDMIKKLKLYEESLVIRTRKITKFKPKSEEEIKKEIKVAQAQIKLYEQKALFLEENNKLFKEKVETEKNKESLLSTELNDLKTDISSKNEEIKFLKLTSYSHLNCPNENRRLIDKYNNLNTAYKYELRRAKQLALMEIENKGEDDQAIKEEYDQIDDKAKAEEDEKNILPKIKVLKFKGETVQKLEMKIMKLNKIGVIKNKNLEAGLKYYKKLNTEVNDNKRYNKKEDLSKYQIIRDKKNKILIKSDDNYLFDKNEETIMERILPENMYNSCKVKFNDILQEKNEIEEIIKADRNNQKKEKDAIVNKCEYNKMELKTQKMDYFKLVQKSQKLRENINKLNQDIKEMKKIIKKEEKKLSEENKMNIYYKKLEKSQKESKK